MKELVRQLIEFAEANGLRLRALAEVTDESTTATLVLATGDGDTITLPVEDPVGSPWATILEDAKARGAVVNYDTDRNAIIVERPIVERPTPSLDRPPKRRRALAEEGSG